MNHLHWKKVPACQDIDFANYLYEQVQNYCKSDFKTNPIKKRLVERAVSKALIDTPYQVNDAMRIISALPW